MKIFTCRTIAEAWQCSMTHFVNSHYQVMDDDIHKAPGLTLCITDPSKRVPAKGTNPLIPFWQSVLSMTAYDARVDIVKKHMPELESFTDNSGKFSLAMGNRFQEKFGFDQFHLLKNSLRAGMQIIPVTIFDPTEDHSLQHRPSTLSAVFSIVGGQIDVMVTMDSLLMHAVPFHSELSVISIWQEMLCAYLGKRQGLMNVVCGGASAVQADIEPFQRLVDQKISPETQSRPIMADESDPEVLMGDFKTWPMVNIGRGYRSEFFRHVVTPMMMVTTCLQEKEPAPQKKLERATGFAEQILDLGWRAYVKEWLVSNFGG